MPHLGRLAGDQQNIKMQHHILFYLHVLISSKTKNCGCCQALTCKLAATVIGVESRRFDCQSRSLGPGVC